MESTMTRPVNSLISGGNPMQSCIDICMKCAQVCEECFNLCLQESDVKDRMNCIKTLQDCSEICFTTASFMSRSSGNVRELCNICAIICQNCAKECSMFEDEHCKTCSDICDECSTECGKMVKM